MYSTDMKNAVSSAQSCIDLCCSSENVAFVSAEYISALAKLLDVLDPSGIDFTKKGFISEMRIKKYWKLLSEHYQTVMAVNEKLRQSRLIAENTLLTLKKEQERYNSALEKFLASEPEENDIEFSSQKTVALNLSDILSNTAAEYEMLSEKLRIITGTSAETFKNAVLIAKMTCQISITSDSSQIVSGNADINAYKSDFKNLSDICR